MGMTPETIAFRKDLAATPPAGKPHSVPLPNTGSATRTPIYRHWRFASPETPLLTTIDPAVKTTHDIFVEAVKRTPTQGALGTRPWNRETRSWENSYAWQTYAEVAERRKNLGAGLVEVMQAVGMNPSSKYGVGIWSQNRAEWQIAELAIVSQALYSVSLYETFGLEASEYIVNHAELPVIFCSLPHISSLLSIAARVPCVKIIISLDPLETGEQSDNTMLSVLNNIAATHNIRIYSMTDVEAIGAQSGRPMRPPHPNDLITINYTSGTTGVPKGVLLTHANAVAAISVARAPGYIKPNDTHMSYLPLAHIYGRLADSTALAENARVGYFRGDIAGLIDDMKLLKPSAFISVPRLYNQFNSALRSATIQAPGFKGALSRKAVEAKKSSMKLPIGQAHNQHFLYDRIWTPKVAAALGLQRCTYMISGSAQLDPEVQMFLRAVLGNKFVQGYGLTESYASAMCQFQGDFSTGNIGAPMPCVEACLESVPDMEYLATDKPYPRGELLLRGSVIFKGYYKLPEETAKVLDADGWFHTGDIASVDELGRFKIINRKKNVLKLAQGEYISPERIENVYMASTPLVTIAYVHGDPLQSSLVAIMGVDPATFAPFASQHLKRYIVPGDTAAIQAACRDPVVRREFLKVLDAIGKKHKFNSFEMVKNVWLEVEPFTVANEMLTPTLKLRRVQAGRAYKEVIEGMYREIAEIRKKAKL